MKAKLFLLTGLAFVTALLLAFSSNNSYSSNAGSNKNYDVLKKNIIRCGPDWEALKDFIEEMDIPPMPGSGTHLWTISTKSDSAQFYFNQGINMYYSFHIIESMASFKKAARFDPGCAMLHWAQALAYGPNINDLGYAASPEALAATEKAKELSGSASPVEKALIDAMAVRYTADSADMNRAKLNGQYTTMMKKAYEKFSTHPDVQALYADAMMLEHPWDLWKIDGTPRPWTPLIRTVLEKLLAKTPDHPGANHYYIHVMEPSPYFAKALPSADRLGKITPGLSHTVHMPSHIYLRAGHYEKGVQVNKNAINGYELYSKLFTPVTNNDFLYLIHNIHMQTNNAMLGGFREESMKAAAATAESIPADYLDMGGAMGSYLQYIHSTPVLVNIRFGNWQPLLDMPQPADNRVYSNIIYRFGRGMAMLAGGRTSDAKRELIRLNELLKDTILLLPFSPFSPAIDGANVAEKILAGSIAVKEERFDDAIKVLQEAVVIEENMVYNEPRDWMLSPKHYLGNAMLKAGKNADAKAVFLSDLNNNNENGWALFGLWQTLSGEKKKAEADKVMARFSKAFAGADVRITGAVF